MLLVKKLKSGVQIIYNSKVLLLPLTLASEVGKLVSAEPSLPEDVLFQELNELLNKDSSKITKLFNGEVFEKNGLFYLTGTTVAMPENLVKTIKESVDAGLPYAGYIKFWKRLLLNKNDLIVTGLFDAMVKGKDGFNITSSGLILGYKVVQIKDKFDPQTGAAVQQFTYDPDNKGVKVWAIGMDTVFTPTIFQNGKYGLEIVLGKEITHPIEECELDHRVECGAGLHVGTWDYVKGYDKEYEKNAGKFILECVVDPVDIISVPEVNKFRGIRYLPVAVYNTDLRVADSVIATISNDHILETKSYYEKEEQEAKAYYAQRLAIIDEFITSK